MASSLHDRDEMLWRAETSILARATAPTATVDLISYLKEESIDEYFVRAAILFLMDRGRLRMTDDRKLLAVPTAHAN